MEKPHKDNLNVEELFLRKSFDFRSGRVREFAIRKSIHKIMPKGSHGESSFRNEGVEDFYQSLYSVARDNAVDSLGEITLEEGLKKLSDEEYIRQLRKNLDSTNQLFNEVSWRIFIQDVRDQLIDIRECFLHDELGDGGDVTLQIADISYRARETSKDAFRDISEDRLEEEILRLGDV